MNNGTATAEFVEISASFYDTNGNIVANEFTYADPSTIQPGARSPFNMYFSDERIEQDAETYEFILQWQDENGSERSRRVITEEGPIDSQQPSQNDTLSAPSQAEQQNLTNNMSGINTTSEMQPTLHGRNVTTTTSSLQAELPIPISIVDGAALEGDKAYQPNPLTVNVGQEVKWTNDDTQIHTATSGTAGSAESGQVFDSGIVVPESTFSFKFDDPGEFPYYCTLHPQMVGTVYVMPSDDRGSEDDSVSSIITDSSNLTEPAQLESSLAVEPSTLDENEILMLADFRLHGNQYLAGRGYYLIKSLNLTTGENSVLCPTNECTYSLEDGQIYPNTSTGGYVIDGRLKTGKESDLGLRSTIQPIKLDLNRLETLEMQDQTTIDFVRGDFDMGENIYSPDITYKITNGTVTKADRNLILNIQGELLGSSNSDLAGDDSKGGPLEQLGRIFGSD